MRWYEACLHTISSCFRAAIAALLVVNYYSREFGKRGRRTVQPNLVVVRYSRINIRRNRKFFFFLTRYFSLNDRRVIAVERTTTQSALPPKLESICDRRAQPYIYSSPSSLTK